MEKITRRNMLARSSVFMASVGAGLSSTAASAESAGTVRKQKIVVVWSTPR